jgi:alkaline phosphatase
MLQAARGPRRAARVAALATIAAAAIAVPTLASAHGQQDPSSAARAAIDGGKARNVIMFLGDGMGDSEITLARNYTLGAAGRLAMDTLPLTGEYTTYAVDQADPTKPNYVTDSAASGTGWSTGHKTYNNAISVTPDGKDVATILELAQHAGFKTGDVTTAELTDATPAVLASHVPFRACQGPADMATCPLDTKQSGGPGSIAEQEVDHGVDVLLGGGKNRFDQTVTGGPFAGQTVTAQAQAQGYTLVTDASSLAATTPSQKVLGLFTPGNMDLEWTGPLAQAFPAGTTPTSCTQSNPDRSAAQPHLAEMTSKAISLLDAKARHNAGHGKSKDSKGFFLQVEGASIDKQDHASNPCGQIGETAAFDAAIAEGLSYAKKHPDTLVVVTADHGHTSQIVEFPQTATHHSTGAIATLLTKDEAPMVVSYATNLVGASQDHTGTEVRIAAQGPQAARVLGVTDQTDLFRTFKAALGLH